MSETDHRPLRDVLREVEACQDDNWDTGWHVQAKRLAREFRALAPVLRRLATYGRDRLVVDMEAARTLLDELEAK